MSGKLITAVSEPRPRLSWAMRGIVLAIAALAISVIWITNSFLTERFTETTRQRAELRQALYAGFVLSELQRNSVVPLLLSRDPIMIAALRSQDFSNTSQRLIEYREEIGAASLVLIDTQGRVVAATDREILGETHRNKPYVIEALRSEDTVFTISPIDPGAFEFGFSRAIRDGSRALGVIQVAVDLAKFEARWRGASEAIVITDSTGNIILSTEPNWRGHDIEAALTEVSAPSAIARAIEATGNWISYVDTGYFTGTAIIQSEARIPFRGWRMISFTSYASVRERVNGILALEIMGFALLLSIAFYIHTRRTQLRNLLFQKESAELRHLNARLSQEIAERERMQETLKEAELSLAQSSKLAALGEMSAAVSHELNQPLAAMKTYLAGAKLLLRRQRVEEALSSFQRVDDLIERMGAITKQLKSYARKGGDDFAPVDLREVLSVSLTMMEPQLRSHSVSVSQITPDYPVLVMADKLRLEQVLINLIRNGIDAMKGTGRPALDIILATGAQAVLSLRDNGPGIENLDVLFEPFYTTKKPGEGLGLGLAISSGIINDLGGRLSARNSTQGGAVFEIRLPILQTEQLTAAE